MHFFHHIILLTFSLLTLTSAWIGIGSHKQNTITSNTNTNANTALAAITTLHSEHKTRMASHAKTMLPLTTGLNKLLASLHTYADTNTNTDKITNNKQNNNVELHLSTLLKFVMSEVAQEDYDLDIHRAVLLQRGGSLEERLRESRRNMKVLEVARWMLGRMEKETQELRVWNEVFRKRVEGVKGAFEEGRGERKGRIVRT